jgi:hypothetical protein
MTQDTPKKTRRRLSREEKIERLKNELLLHEQARNKDTRTRILRLHRDLAALIESGSKGAWTGQLTGALNALKTAADQVPVPKEQ